MTWHVTVGRDCLTRKLALYGGGRLRRPKA